MFHEISQSEIMKHSGKNPAVDFVKKNGFVMKQLKEKGFDLDRPIHQGLRAGQMYVFSQIGRIPCQ